MLSSNDRGRPACDQAASNVNHHNHSQNTPWITGSVSVDLTDVAENRRRHEVYFALIAAPAGTEVILHVGPLHVSLDVLHMVWENGRHVTIKVTGHGNAVASWIDALRNGTGAL